MPLLIALLISFFSLCANAQSAQQPLNDGPYVFHQEKSSQAVWICDGEMKTVPLAARAKLRAPCGSVSGFALNRSNPIAADEIPPPKRWAAVSDIHGQARLFLSLLRKQKIIGAKNQWTFGKGVLVITGDVFDRGPEQTEALWAIYRLSQEARVAGGSVQMLLGNHESMVLRGDLRYQPPQYLAAASLLQRTVPELYGKDSELGQWLRSRPAVLKMGDTLFVHGGLSPEMLKPPLDSLSIQQINTKIRERLGDSRDALKDDTQASWLFGSNGPLWYRGYFSLPRASIAEIDALLARFAVKRIVVGHTTRDEIVSLYGGRVIGIDAALKEGVRGELLVHESKQLLRGLPDGSRTLLPPGDDDGTVNALLPDAEDRAAAKDTKAKR